MTVPKEVDLSADIDIEKVAAANPGSYPVQIRLGDFLWKDGRIDDAYRALERAAQLVPIAVGPTSPHVMMAKIAIEKKDSARTIRELEAVLQTSTRIWTPRASWRSSCSRPAPRRRRG